MSELLLICAVKLAMDLEFGCLLTKRISASSFLPSNHCITGCLPTLKFLGDAEYWRGPDNIVIQAACLHNEDVLLSADIL